MAKYRLHAGAEIDLLTKGELDKSLKHITDTFGIWRSFAYGLKQVTFPVARATIFNGAVTIGSTDIAGAAYLGPPQGFSWRVTRVSVWGLNEGDIVQVYRGDPRDATFVAAIQAPGSTTSTAGLGATLLTSHGLLLRPGDHIAVTGAALNAAGTITVTGEAIEAPADMVYKLIGG